MFLLHNAVQFLVKIRLRYSVPFNISAGSETGTEYLVHLYIILMHVSLQDNLGLL